MDVNKKKSEAKCVNKVKLTSNINSNKIKKKKHYGKI